MPNACTIIACNYLPFATVLADSFFAHHPDGRFTVLLIDDEARRSRRRTDRGSSGAASADLGLDAEEIRRLAGSTTSPSSPPRSSRCCCSTLLARGRDAVLYLDPDIRIYGSLDEASSLRRQHGIVLTPHIDAAASARRPPDRRVADPRLRRLQPRVHRRQRAAARAVSRLVVGGDAPRSAERSHAA